MAASQTTRDVILGILAKCQNEQWYGSDRERSRNPSAHDPCHTGFVFPSATTDQITQTEASVGFALPPLLSQLYTRLANGGFGPGGGIRGCIGGYGTPMSMGDDAGTLLG